MAWERHLVRRNSGDSFTSSPSASSTSLFTPPTSNPELAPDPKFVHSHSAQQAPVATTAKAANNVYTPSYGNRGHL